MTRINLIGASGTGKTTLAQALAVRLGWPAFDSDAYFHLPTDPPFQQQRPPAERWRLLAADTALYPDWLLSGSTISWGGHPTIAFELIVFLTLPQDLRLERLRRRERERFGTRLDPGGDMHADHLDFMAWTAGYDSGSAELNSLPIHEAWLSTLSCPILRLHEPQSTAAQVDALISAINLLNESS